jgi:hypothetical protein
MAPKETHMTHPFTTAMQSLLDDLKQKELTAELVDRFIATGGAHRISVTVDHPDPAVKAAVDAVARHVPADRLLRGFENFSREQVLAARVKLHEYVGTAATDAARPEVSP